MDPEDTSRAGGVEDARGQLQHDLKTPLTTIYGRAQLLRTAIRRSPSLAEEERTSMLAGLAALEEAALILLRVIDRMGDDSRES